jgi:opacity protein-like surface antigen
MKIRNKILTTVVISGCFLSEHASYAAPINAYVGASMGFQRGSGPLKGDTFFNANTVNPAFRAVTTSYPGHIGQSDPAGNLFLEVDAKVNNCFSLGLRPYYHLDTFDTTVTKNGDLKFNPAAPPGILTESVEFSLRRRHAYGILFVPKVHLKEVTLYGLLGAEFSRFKAKINRTLSRPGLADTTSSFAKGMSSSAAVFGLGVSRELGNWSLFAEGQYKHYQAKKFEEVGIALAVAPTSQFLKFSPKFASLMFGVKFKLI